jgi:hypothetical protein
MQTLKSRAHRMYYVYDVVYVRPVLTVHVNAHSPHTTTQPLSHQPATHAGNAIPLVDLPIVL